MTDPVKRDITPGMTLHGVRRDKTKGNNWAQYTVGEPLKSADNRGEGGAGYLHRLLPRSKPRLVGKFYKSSTRTRLQRDREYAQRLIYLVFNRHILLHDLPFVAWPRRCLFLHKPQTPQEMRSALIGITMAELADTRPLSAYLGNPDYRDVMTPTLAAKIGVTIAQQLALMHAHPWRFVLGDFSANNIHIHADLKKVTFIDADSYQFTGTAKGETHLFFNGNVTPHYESPDMDAMRKAGEFKTSHDDFLLAINLYYLLLAGFKVPRHPFEARDSTHGELIRKRIFPVDNPKTYAQPQSVVDAYRCLPEPVRKAFTRTFSTPSVVTASEWAAILKNTAVIRELAYAS
ncbi:hypothetical protein HYPGJ_31614 [Hyphomicrobium sp. GJ21]|uniref:hypothetical protein n=1 Tax=Hyphomicrobium sp. GJ21 TaxID=113574 RepID=UPI000622BA48|nr:hypothetical protein [Hyphomicrobium sp. GJ21]CEJ88130.1 hypothetical protein HYPGJ_31614 [Hyphomicrobium sp. GJ21]